MNFGVRLKILPKNKHLTQQQLADRLGVAKSVVSYYETGDRFPSYDVLIKIARTFHVTTDYLLGMERTHMLHISGLTEEDIAVVETVADALRKKKS